MKQLEITLRRSLIKSTPNQRATAKALGLTKLNKTIVKDDNASIRGMLRVIDHLVTIVEK
ncbi:MAG: 50S ribosomal protein L30 [Candidatus Izemoplasmataceae bacterium]